MQTDALTSALERRGLTVKENTDAFGRPTLKIKRPGAHAMLAEDVTMIDGVACWSWGTRVTPSPEPDVVASLIDRVVSIAPSEIRNSA